MYVWNVSYFFITCYIASNWLAPCCLIVLYIITKIFLLHILFINVEKFFPDSILSKMAREAFGSPHLMQEFCKTLCRKYNIIKKTMLRTTISINDNELEKIYTEIAQNTGRPTFDRLARGARPRSDRKERLLKDGAKTDIYGVVMMALKCLRPGMSRISYEELRSTIKEHLQESPPQRHEVTRVLDIITQISYNDSASTPVIEWNKEDSEIHITDPFFAFYLTQNCIFAENMG